MFRGLRFGRCWWDPYPNNPTANSGRIEMAGFLGNPSSGGTNGVVVSACVRSGQGLYGGTTIAGGTGGPATYSVLSDQHGFRLRWRALSSTGTGFRRDWTSATDSKIPIPVKAGAVGGKPKRRHLHRLRPFGTKRPLMATRRARR